MLEERPKRPLDSFFFLWIIVAVLVFTSGFIVGLLRPDVLESLLGGSLSELKDLASQLAPFQFSTFVWILLRNETSLVISFILSPLFCIVPLVSLFVNGWIIGLIAAIAVEKVGLLFLLLGILPHGIFELPAFFIGEAAALSSGLSVILAIFSPARRRALPRILKRNVVLLLIAMSLLVPAALIETYVTPLFLR